MAVKSYALTTGQRAADFGELGTLSGAKLIRIEIIIDASTDFIENYIGFRVKQTTYTNEVYDTERGETLQLKNYPVSSTESFSLQRRNTSLNEDDWTTIDSKNYIVDFDSGVVQYAFGIKFSATRAGYRASYTAGHDFDNSSTFLSETGAGDLELACWLLTLAIYTRGAEGAGVKSERIGDYSVSFQKTMFENEDVKSILDKYAGQDEFGVLTPTQN